MKRYTEGPWEILGSTLCKRSDPDFNEYVQIDLTNPANRRLVIAAPLLVDALQSVVEHWTLQFERQGHLAPAWCKQAREALEQALGECVCGVTCQDSGEENCRYKSAASQKNASPKGPK